MPACCELSLRSWKQCTRGVVRQAVSQREPAAVLRASCLNRPVVPEPEPDETSLTGPAIWPCSQRLLQRHVHPAICKPSELCCCFCTASDNCPYVRRSRRTLTRLQQPASPWCLMSSIASAQCLPATTFCGWCTAWAKALGPPWWGTMCGCPHPAPTPTMTGGPWLCFLR